jgi:hypothetical protein
LVEMWFRFIGATAKPEEIFVLQYVSEDLQNGWRSRGTQLDVVDSLGTIDNSIMLSSRTPVLRYYLDALPSRMILIAWRGMRAGQGFLLTRTGDDWKPERLKWKT